jgi:uncharacterized membrane protein YuzA (DUF378 family)
VSRPWAFVNFLAGLVVLWVIGAAGWASRVIFALVGLALGAYALLPLVVHRRFRHQTEGGARNLDPNSPDIPEAVRAHWNRAAPRLTLAGFTRLGCVHEPGSSLNPERYVMVWFHHTTHVGAGVVVLVAGAPGTRRTESWTTMITRLVDGRQAETMNAADPANFAELAPGPLTQVPQLGDARQLYAVHSAVLSRWLGAGPDAPRETVQRGTDALVVYRTALRQWYERLAGAGWMRVESDGTTFRPTWAGAARLAWLNVWPALHLRRATTRRRGESLISGLGIVSPYASQSAPTPLRPVLPWVALAAVGFIVMLYAMTASLGAVSWAVIGIAGARFFNWRRRRLTSWRELLAGGALAIAGFVATTALVALRFAPSGQVGDGILAAGATLVVLPIALFTAGTIAVWQGWMRWSEARGEEYGLQPAE